MLDWSDIRNGTASAEEAQAVRESHERAERERFLRRVRLPLSGFVAALFSRLDAWRAALVERRAQVRFERCAL